MLNDRFSILNVEWIVLHEKYLFVLLFLNRKSIDSSSSEEHSCIRYYEIICWSCSCERNHCNLFSLCNSSWKEDRYVCHAFFARWRSIVMRCVYSRGIGICRIRIIDKHKSERLRTLEYFFAVDRKSVICDRIADIRRWCWCSTVTTYNICRQQSRSIDSYWYCCDYDHGNADSHKVFVEAPFSRSYHPLMQDFWDKQGQITVSSSICNGYGE